MTLKEQLIYGALYLAAMLLACGIAECINQL